MKIDKFLYLKNRIEAILSKDVKIVGIYFPTPLTDDFNFEIFVLVNGEYIPHEVVKSKTRAEYMANRPKIYNYANNGQILRVIKELREKYHTKQRD